MMNATLLTLDRFLPDFADTVIADEALFLVASSAANWARAAERVADHTYGAALVLVNHLDGVELSLSKITEISIVLDTANASYTQQKVATMTNEFGVSSHHFLET